MEMITILAWLVIVGIGIGIAYKLFPEAGWEEKKSKKRLFVFGFFRAVILFAAAFHPMVVTYPAFLGDGMPARLQKDGTIEKLPFGIIGLYETFRMHDTASCDNIVQIRLDNGINFQAWTHLSGDVRIIDEKIFYREGSSSINVFCDAVRKISAKELLTEIRSGSFLDDDQHPAKDNSVRDRMISSLRTLEPTWGVRFQE